MGKKQRRPSQRRGATSLAERAPEAGTAPWYAAEGERGQQLLEQGRVREATEIFEAVLARFGETPSYGRAVILGRLGRCLHLAGEPLPALGRYHEALELTERLAPSPGVRSLRGVMQCELGDALRTLGRHDEARAAYLGALETAELEADVRAQVVDLGQLGALELDEGRLDEAQLRYRSALRLLQRLDEPSLEAATRSQIARIQHRSGQPEQAERQYRRAIEFDRRIGDAAGLVRNLSGLAELLQGRPEGLPEARALAGEALATAQARDPTGAAVWRLYGLLAGIAEREAAAAPADGPRAALEAQARDYRELERRAPQIAAALASLADAPSQGRAVLLGQLGRCLALGRRADLALGPIRAGLDSLAALAPSATVRGLHGMLLSELGDSLRAVGQDAEARDAHQESLEVAEELRDRREHRHEPGDDELEVTLHDDVAIDYGFEPDLLVHGRRDSHVERWAGEPEPLAGELRPLVTPGALSWLDAGGAVRFRLPAGEPIVESDPGCVILRRTRRDVAVRGSTRLVWRLVEALDGTATVEEILGGLAEADRKPAGRILAALAATGAIDVSGRAIGRYLQSATKKGVLPAGGLGGEEVLRLATDTTYRAYPDAPRLALGAVVPERLEPLHALTRARRSRRDYADLAIAREQFEAVLQTACGVTGALDWAGRQLQLRAYPSSGALYAVEIYPVVFRVAGLEAAVYHYRADEHALETVRPEIDRDSFIRAALPMERQMVAATAAMFCLTGWFPRHERKYGEGGYRMLVAEAGHISQNLVLAATALGLSARPFGGVFDRLLNEALGLDGDEEAFLLAVLVGHVNAT